MPESEPMMCPVCGVAMNHHADKIDQSAAAEADGAGAAESALVIVEAHTCPECGQTHTRSERAGA
jgi:ribosomal protein S27AE